MANDVFANGLEVACKAADGVSSAAFPDVCWTPKEPVPFANTAKAKDLANGTVTVFISGKPVAQKDKSYFKTSSGDDAARGAKGFSTGAKNGKAYFRSWSMNVKVEGYNVCRHTDYMTHNHGSYTGNTGNWKYWDTGWFKAPCKDEFDKVERACGGQKSKKEKSFFGGTHKVWKNNKKYVAGGWKKKHCRFLNFYPKDLNSKALEDPNLLNDLKDKIANASNISNVVTQASSAAMDLAKEKLIKLGVKMVATKFVPGIGWIYSIATAADDIADVKYYTAMYNGAKAEYTRMVDNVQNVGEDITKAIKDIASGDTGAAAKTIANWQRNAATLDDCLRARKCMLVPYNETPSQKPDKKNKTDKGCCNGQTGHHLIPDKFVDKSGCKDGKGKPYAKSTAPTVCAEGTSTALGGSHQALHTATTEMLVPEKNWGNYKATEASYEDVRDGVIKAHAKTFPFSACSKSCLKAQLDKYHNDCGKLSVKKMGKDPSKEPSSGTSGR